MPRPAPLVLTLTLAVGLVGGCSGAVRPAVVQAWVGRPAAALQQEWGSATREVEDAGLRLLIYDQVERASGTTFRPQTSASPLAAANTGATTSETGSLTVYVRSYLFWVNRDGTIVRAEARQP